MEIREKKQNKVVVAKKSIVSYMRELRSRVSEEKKDVDRFSEQVVSTDRRRGVLNGKYVDRLVVFLKGTGCSIIKKNGGCTCCGFYSISNLGDKIEDSFYIKEIHDIINDQDNKISDFNIVCLYNDGSLLVEEELSFKVLIYMIQTLNSIDSIEKIVIEAKVNDITEEKLKKIREVTDKAFEITVGFESANQKVRELCVNRPFTNESFEKKVELAKAYNISIVPLLMVKPAFLSEIEAVEDFVSSLVYLEKFNLERIDMELPTVVRDTLNYDLWAKEMYKPITFWSVIEILQRRAKLDLKVPLYISPMVYSVEAVDKAGNCDKCNESIYKMFEQYNESGEVSIFDKVDCGCKENWKQMMNETSSINNLEDRVIDVLNELKSNPVNS
ncbi:radical SAM protein [Bacillus thuringiensis]|uniref:radical SAM protein n=1 Tax=Bacillus thuringiensis TaxID=1428 RepID=UPI000BED533E|nr:radical SAM protein [Bacillus thuringiensis]MCU5407913.1 radical SAM protein [Bacillus cereus]PEC94342.1 radical SAM protein [Bacillus thuringiensis]HDR8244002.1 radical SAM protein [Bacillus cereus]